jgi:hypothetical protein
MIYSYTIEDKELNSKEFIDYCVKAYFSDRPDIIEHIQNAMDLEQDERDGLLSDIIHLVSIKSGKSFNVIAKENSCYQFSME